MKVKKLKLAGVLLGATLITSTASIADEVLKSAEKMMVKDTNSTSKAIMKKKEMQEHAKAADAKHATQKWG